MRRLKTSLFGGVLLVLPVYASAAQPPHTFVEGEPALAAEVNENFLAVAGPDQGRIFIAPKAIDAGLLDEARTVSIVTETYTAAFGKPSDYVANGAEDVSIRLLLSGCLAANVIVQVDTDYLNAGANVIDVDQDVIPEFLMPAEATTIVAPSVTRTGLGDVNYVTVTRNFPASAPDCGVGELFLHGIIIEYPR